MYKNIKNMNKEIQNGKLLEENIPKLFNQLADHYDINAKVRLSMHYFAFYEAYCDDENTWSKDSMQVTSRINNIIKDNILDNKSGQDREKAIESIDAIRKDIMKRMEVLTAYTDIFQTFEYVLNRLEYRFKEEVVTFDEGEFAREILRFIFEQEDNVIINEKIKEIIGQLPIRITKQRYFELLKGSIQAYLGSDISSLESYLYIMKTSAMLYKEEGMENLYPGLWEKKELLSRMDYKEMTKEYFEKALTTLQAATITLEIETTVYFTLQEIANEVYALLLCLPYAGMTSSQTSAAEVASVSIIKEVNELFINNEKQDIPIEHLDKFTDVEGIQEELSFEIAMLEDGLYEIETNYKILAESLMLSQVLQVLLRSKDLLSNSIFINFEDNSSEEEIVDEVKIEEVVNSIVEDLTDLFNNHDRVITRAVMANTLNKMLVFFIDHKEVMDYVNYSLERCTDAFEKSACFEIINEIMSE